MNCGTSGPLPLPAPVAPALSCLQAFNSPLVHDFVYGMEEKVQKLLEKLWDLPEPWTARLPHLATGMGVAATQLDVLLHTTRSARSMALAMQVNPRAVQSGEGRGRGRARWL